MVKNREKKKKEDSEEISEGAQLCPKCGSQMLFEEGEIVCPKCDGEIDFFGDSEE